MAKSGRVASRIDDEDVTRRYVKRESNSIRVKRERVAKYVDKHRNEVEEIFLLSNFVKQKHRNNSIVARCYTYMYYI